MSKSDFFGFLGLLLVTAFAANSQYKRTRIPDLLILMGVGLLVGPLTGLLDISQFRDFTQYLGTLALILILFEGGLELDLKSLAKHLSGAAFLSLVGFGLSLGFVAIVAVLMLGMPISNALLIGAVVGCTSSAMVMPVLQQLAVNERVRITLLLEASFGDVIAVLAVGNLIEVSPEKTVLTGLLTGVISKLIFSLLIALAAGYIWSRVSRLLTLHRFTNALTFGVVLVVYALSHLLGGSGFLSVLCFGLVLGNQALLRISKTNYGASEVRSFHAEMSFLIRSFFFVLLGASVERIGDEYWLPAGVIIVALILARFITLQFLRPSLRDLHTAERSVLMWMMPRGLITAVLAVTIFEAKGAEFAFLPALAFLVILTTNIFLIFVSYRAGQVELHSENAAFKL